MASTPDSIGVGSALAIGVRRHDLAILTLRVVSVRHERRIKFFLWFSLLLLLSSVLVTLK